MSRARDIASGINTRDDSGEAVPHIIPGVLYPAYVASGTSPKLLDGTTTHGTGTYNGVSVSTAYGTVQADGRKYYYTNIAGSKPIKDPRIGGHFGSQRHRTSSLQLLEQETATHGTNVYSVDGRDWIRVTSDDWVVGNGNYGNGIYVTGDGTLFLEIVGYFSDVNTYEYTHPSRNRSLYVDGAIVGSVNGFSGTASSVVTPLTARYVNSGSLVNYGLNQTLGIHTLKVVPQSSHFLGSMFNIELIAQDTSSDANRSKIQIPSQDVVSYGKKFNVSGTPHYNPFNNQAINNTTSHGKNTTGWTTYDPTLHVDSSLGLDAWHITSGGDAGYYRPVNGGRIIKWVDENGNIKTSVNMMPPAGRHISGGGNNGLPTGTSWVTSYQPSFMAGAIDHTQSEIAKTFHFREFGNGSANGNASYPDPSTLVRTGGTHNTAFVMDDGLTSLSCFNMYDYGDYGLRRNNAGDVHFTFIGTGLTIKGKTYTTTVASNLPYGTHVFRQHANGTSGNSDGGDWYIDGVIVKTFSGASGAVNQLGDYGILELTIHQPKRPPIPEDACVLADYMLMADFVPQTNGDLPHISKGIRYCSVSRDSFIDGNSATATKFFYNILSGTGGFQISLNQNGYTLSEGRIVGFGHSFGVNFMRDTDRMTDVQARLDGNPYTYNSSDIWDTDTVWDDTNGDGTLTKSGSTAQEVYGIKNQTLGLHTFGDKTTTNPSANKFNDWIGWQIATPIHTSSHYQPFETLFLHELVGGDRNMEQTNLVCSPDGKSWDSLTRDTSYLGNIRLHASEDGQNADPIILTDFRGVHRTNGNYYQKFFAIGYDRFICLKAGQYEIKFTTYNNTTTTHSIKINGTAIQSTAMGNTSYTVANATTADAVVSLNRGDYVQISGKWYNQEMSHFSITEV